MKGIIVGDGKKIVISNIGSGVLQIKNKGLFSVNNLLHTPFVASNLISIQKLCVDNNVLSEF